MESFQHFFFIIVCNNIFLSKLTYKNYYKKTLYIKIKYIFIYNFFAKFFVSLSKYTYLIIKIG